MRRSLELACWGILITALPTDALNGFVVQQLGVRLPLSLAAKGAAVAVLGIWSLLFRPLAFTALIAPISLALFTRPLLSIAGGELSALEFDLPVAARLLLVPLCLLFFSAQLQERREQSLRFLQIGLWTATGVLLLNIFAGTIDIGFATYPSTGIGYKGFFVAGNEVSAVLIVCAAFSLHHSWRNKTAPAFILFAVVLFVASALLATKSAIIAVLALAVAIPLLGNDVRRPTKRAMVAVASGVVCLAITAWLSVDWILGTDIGRRLSFVYDRLGLVDLVFSGRLAFADRYVDSLVEDGSIAHVLFGFGSANLIGFGPASTELDPVDLAIMFGVPIALTATIAGVLSFCLPALKLRSRPFAAASFLANLLLFAFAVTAGHVWTSGMLAIPWMMLTALGSVDLEMAAAPETVAAH